MCSTCGCSDGGAVRIEHHHGGHDAPSSGTVTLEQRILAKNDGLADRNRSWLRGHGILAVNLMSSPGAGKTTLLERTIGVLRDEVAVSVVEGDQETLLDAERIRATGSWAVQVNTGAGCHLDAEMIAGALEALAPPRGSVVFIENVGNLVCPSLFDLGEGGRVVIMSVTEGVDKPVKYPHMFRSADAVVLTKVDLQPYLDFEVDAWLRSLRLVNPVADVLRVSATAGTGLDDWTGWLRAQRDREVVRHG